MAASEDLRIRLVRKVVSGLSRRQAAAHFEVSASSAVRYVKQYEEEGHENGGDKLVHGSGGISQPRAE